MMSKICICMKAELKGSLIKINIKGSGFVTGKVIDAFGKAGKKERLVVKVPSEKVSSYNSLFKGEGKLNPEAKVVKAA